MKKYILFILLTLFSASAYSVTLVKNKDVDPSAAIATSKLAAKTASKVAVTDSSGFLAASSTDSSALTYLDASSSIQTQLDGMLKLLGRSGGQVGYGGTASGDDLDLSSTSHATKGDVWLGQNIHELANGKILLGSGARAATTATGAVHIKSGAGYNDAMVLEGPAGGYNADQKWIMYGDSSQFIIAKQSPSEGNLAITNQERIAIGDGTANYKLHLGRSSASTTPAAPTSVEPVFAIRNNNSTANNYAMLLMENAGQFPSAAFVGVHEGHLTGSSGYASIYTRNAGTFQESLRIKADGAIDTTYGTGILHSDSNGLVSSSTIATADIASNAVTGAKLNADVVQAQSTVTAATDDYVLIADTSNSGNVKKALVSDIGGGGYPSQFVAAYITGANQSYNSSNTTYADITNASWTMTALSGSASVQIPCSSTNASSGTTCSSGTEDVGVVFTNATSGYYEVCAQFSWQRIPSTTDEGYLGVKWVETPNNAQTISQDGIYSSEFGGDMSSNAAAQRPSASVNHCNIFYFSSSAQRTLRLFYISRVTGGSIQIQGASTNPGEGGSGQSYIAVTVKKISN